MSEAPPRRPGDRAVLAVGLASVLLCPLLGPVALTLARSARRSALAEGLDPAGEVVVGRALGLAGSALLVLLPALAGLLALLGLLPG